MRIRLLKHITEDMEISILPTVPIGLMQKKVRLLLRKLGTVEHNKFVDYILLKKLANLAFYKQLNYCQNYSAPKKGLPIYTANRLLRGNDFTVIQF